MLHSLVSCLSYYIDLIIGKSRFDSIPGVYIVTVACNLRKTGENMCDTVPFVLITGHFSVNFILCVER
jgi:hypothetical protein